MHRVAALATSIGLLCNVVPGCATHTALGGDASLETVQTTRIGFFRFDAVLNDIARAQLDSVAAYLTEHPDVTAAFTGHAYESKDSARNFSIARRRLASVRAHMDALGIDRERYSTDNRGDADPYIAIENISERRHGNRIEVTIRRPKLESATARLVVGRIARR